jgi:hypothetical protein
MHLSDSSTQDTTTDMAYGVFSSYDWPRLARSRGQLGVSVLGACAVISFQGASANISDPVLPDMPDAGAELTLVGPDGTSHSLTPSVKGSYSALLGRTGFLFPQTDKLYLTAGKYTLTGPGGKNVGPFSASLTLAPFTWTSSSTVNQGSINRKAGLTVAWTEGKRLRHDRGVVHRAESSGNRGRLPLRCRRHEGHVHGAAGRSPPCLTVERGPDCGETSGLDVAHFSVSTSTSVTASYQ